MKIQDILNTHVIEVDDLRLSIVLYNLISNCVKFTDMGSISISAKILDKIQMEEKMRQHQIKIQQDNSDSFDLDLSQDNAETDQHYLAVSVSDTGMGMPEAKKTSCFKLNNGLTAAHLICKALKGQLFLIRSKEDDGTKFQLIIQAKIGDLINMIDDKQVKKLKEMDLMQSIMSS